MSVGLGIATGIADVGGDLMASGNAQHFQYVAVDSGAQLPVGATLSILVEDLR